MSEGGEEPNKTDRPKIAEAIEKRMIKLLHLKMENQLWEY